MGSGEDSLRAAQAGFRAMVIMNVIVIVAICIVNIVLLYIICYQLYILITFPLGLSLLVNFILSICLFTKSKKVAGRLAPEETRNYARLLNLEANKQLVDVNLLNLQERKLVTREVAIQEREKELGII